tara:strand:- start:67 stop:498 length:432 start_codon:yes stop_codon:yes gene_type:complete
MVLTAVQRVKHLERFILGTVLLVCTLIIIQKNYYTYNWELNIYLIILMISFIVAGNNFAKISEVALLDYKNSVVNNILAFFNKQKKRAGYIFVIILNIVGIFGIWKLGASFATIVISIILEIIFYVNSHSKKINDIMKKIKKR